MHPILITIILGIVEGLTEFLPVSSTAHLRITEAWLGLPMDDPYWKMYTIVIQLGAILCLPIYFRKRIAKFLGTFPKGERGDRTVANHPLTLVCIAFICTAIPAWALTKVIGKNLESLYVMGTALLVGGVIMWAVDWIYGWTNVAGDHDLTPGRAAPAADPGSVSTAPPTGGTARMEDMKLWQAVWIGLVQILSAVFPGTSRSMSTIAAGQLAGMSRPSALEFSFFLSMPTMVVATCYDFLKTVILHKGAPGETLPPIHPTTDQWLWLAIGFVVSFLVAWAVVAWFMNWVRNRGFAPFAIYRIIVGAAVLVWAYRHF